MPLISVIIPVYKVEPYLQRCVDSILAQTFADFELILVDDGSPDSCGAMCDEYAQKDARVHVIHQENGGLSAARNAGIDWVFAHSDSRWLTFVDSDDWVHPQMLEKLYHAVLEYNVKVSICGYEETGEDNQWTNADAAQVKLWPVEQFYTERNVNATVAWGKLYARECFADIRYPVGKIHEDEYVTYRILFQFEQVAVIDMPMYAYFVNPQGITRSIQTLKRLDMLQAIEEQLAYFQDNEFRRASAYRMSSYYIALSTLERQLSIFRMKEFAAKRDIRKRKHSLFLKMSEAEKRSAFNYLYPEMMKNYWRLRKVIDLIRNR